MKLKALEKEMENKCNKVTQELKKKISDLTGELHMLKYGKKIPSNLEEYQNEINIEEDANMVKSEDENEKQIQKYDEKEGTNGIRVFSSNKSTSQGITRVVDVGTVTKNIGNTVVTTKTTKISYKRRRVGNNQQENK